MPMQDGLTQKFNFLGVHLTDPNEYEKKYGKDNVFGLQLDVTNSESIASASQAIALQFGGLDIVVNNAGISISKSFEDHSDQDWEKLNDLLVMGQFRISKLGVSLMKQQGLGGDIVNIVSKNALVSGPKNVAYVTAKAAQ